MTKTNARKLRDAIRAVEPLPQRQTTSRRGRNSKNVVEVVEVIKTQNTQSGNRNGNPRRRNRGRRGRAQGTMNVVAPLATAPVYRNIRGITTTIVGTDYLDTDTVKVDTKDGLIVQRMQLNPMSWVGSHAAVVAKGYERFRFRSLQIRLSSRAPTTTSGGYVAGINPDPNNEMRRHNARRSVRALYGSVSSPWWASTTLPTLMLQNNWLFCDSADSDRRLWSAGELLVVVDGSPANITGSIRLTTECSYTIEFMGPTVQEEDKSEPTLTLTQGDQKTTADKRSVLADGDWDKAWNMSAYEIVYLLAPEWKDIGKNAMGDTVPAKYARSANYNAGTHVFVFFEDYDSAFDAGPNPQGSDLTTWALEFLSSTPRLASNTKLEPE